MPSLRAPGPPALGVSTFRIGPFTITGNWGDVSEPLDLDPAVPVPPPDGFQCDDNGLERRIAWRWFSWEAVKGIFFVVVFGVPFAFTLYAYLNTPADKPWPAQAMAFLLLFGLPPALFAYTWLCYLVNRTTLSLNRALLSVRHGPLPWWGAKDVLLADIARVFSEKLTHSSIDTSDGTPFEPREVYVVKVLLKGGKTIKLVTGLLAAEQAMFIEQQVRRG